LTDYGNITIIANVKLEKCPVKPCLFVGPSRQELRAFPDEVKASIGHALHQAQCGEEAVSAKALKGFGGRSILEIVEDFDGNTYRAVYTVRFAGAIYVLHAFQKKSKKGIATPKHTLELIKLRLRDAETHYRRQSTQGESP
jgi:phage-related protein